MTPSRPRKASCPIVFAACAAMLVACSSSSSPPASGSGGASASGGASSGGATGVGGVTGSGGGGVTGSGGATSASSSSTLDLNGFGQKYKLADNEVSGWKQDTAPNAFSVWLAAKLTDKIDGQAPTYTERGLNFALYQSLVGPDPQICTLVAMDFVTADQATSMFAYSKDHTGADVSIPQYDTSIAIGAPALTGMTVYTHFKSMYYEVQLDGNSDPASSGQVASTFLKALEAKTN